MIEMKLNPICKSLPAWFFPTILIETIKFYTKQSYDSWSMCSNLSATQSFQIFLVTYKGWL